MAEHREHGVGDNLLDGKAAQEQKNLEIFKHASELDRFYDNISWRVLPIFLSLSVAFSAVIVTPFRLSLLVGWIVIFLYGLWIWIAGQFAELQKIRTRPIIINYYQEAYPSEKEYWAAAWRISDNWNIPYLVVWAILLDLMIILSVFTFLSRALL